MEQNVQMSERVNGRKYSKSGIWIAKSSLRIKKVFRLSLKWKKRGIWWCF
jgi:hypothetical protein